MKVKSEFVLPDILRKAQQGNESALQFLYSTYSKAMFNICIRMSGDRDDAEDLLQNSFMVAFQNLRQLHDPEKFGGWLKRIVVNECIRFCKKRISYDSWNDQDFQGLAEEVESGWWRDVSLDEIHKHIKALPDGCRIVFNLYVLEDFSHKQIADNLGISEGTSKSQYSRAKSLLKDRIIKQLQHNG